MSEEVTGGKANPYVGLFGSAKDVIAQFDANDDALDGAIVYVAWYEDESYSGTAFVLFEKDGKLWEVNGGHCSCCGLEGQWSPEETTWEAIAHIYRNGTKFGTSPELQELINERVPLPEPEAQQ